MDNPGIYDAINRLLTVLERSLPIYLSYAKPWTRKGDQKATTALAHIVEDQQKLAARATELVLELGPTNQGEYPNEFYDVHDLSLDFLLSKLVEFQKLDVTTLQRCAEQLRSDRQAAEVADEALGAARGHLETLEELAADLGKSSSTWLLT